ELAPLAVIGDPTVVHPRRVHSDRPRADGHLPRPALAVADDEGVAVGVAVGGVGFQVGGDLGLQGRQEHAAGGLARALGEHGSPGHLLLRRLVPDDLQHGCRLLPTACDGAAVAQAGGYVGNVTGSTIHNFRSYLVEQHRDETTGVMTKNTDGKLAMIRVTL